MYINRAVAIAIASLILTAITTTASVRILISFGNHVRIVLCVYVSVIQKAIAWSENTRLSFLFCTLLQQYKPYLVANWRISQWLEILTFWSVLIFCCCCCCSLSFTILPHCATHVEANAANDVQCTKTQYLHGQSKVLSKAHTHRQTLYKNRFQWKCCVGL